MSKPVVFDWTERAIDTLRELWREGLSTAQIGLRMGCSKNAIISKARRVPGCDPRPSPLRAPNPNSHAKKPPRVVKLTLPSDAKRTNPVPRSPFLQPMPPPDVAFKDMMGPEVHLRLPVRRSERLPVPVGAHPPARTCQWTDSTRAPWVFCGCQAVAGYSWCADHKARVFDYRNVAA